MTGTRETRRYCNRASEAHVSPLETRVDDGNVLYEYCSSCTQMIILGRVSQRMADQYRRAQRRADERRGWVS